MERTFAIIKPDAVANGSAGAILADIEKAGFKLKAIRMTRLSRPQAEGFYAVHKERPFFNDLVAFMSRSPAFVAVLEGPVDTFKVVRTMMGATNPRDAAPGTIRGDFGLEVTENLVHGSDSPESAAREIALWFGEDEIV